MFPIIARLPTWLRLCRAPHNRKQADGLAAIVQQALAADPFCGTVYVFRSKRTDRVKLLWWDGTGICLLNKDLPSYCTFCIFS